MVEKGKTRTVYHLTGNDVTGSEPQTTSTEHWWKN